MYCVAGVGLIFEYITIFPYLSQNNEYLNMIIGNWKFDFSNILHIHNRSKIVFKKGEHLNVFVCLNILIQIWEILFSEYICVRIRSTNKNSPYSAV